LAIVERIKAEKKREGDLRSSHSEKPQLSTKVKLFKLPPSLWPISIGSVLFV